MHLGTLMVPFEWMQLGHRGWRWRRRQRTLPNWRRSGDVAGRSCSGRNLSAVGPILQRSKQKRSG